MSHVPAWKRLGLKVKETPTEETFAVTTHFDGGALTNKVAKKLNKKRLLEENKDNKTKKPPKRVKKPKTERGPPPEKDQLLYLRQFVLDKDNWKFSKQKQNWLLKNIESIPDSYENDLISYFEDIQGGARERVEADLRAVIDGWNEYSRKLEEKINAELYGEKTTESESRPDNDGSESEESIEKQNKKSEAEVGPSKAYALRCKKLLSAMLDEPVHLEGEDDTEAKENADESVHIMSEDTSKVSDSEVQLPEDNLIVEDVEVEEYDQKDTAHNKPSVSETSTTKDLKAEGMADSTGEKKKSKKEKKAKKSKKTVK